MTHPKLVRFKDYEKTIKFFEKHDSKEKRIEYLRGLPDEALAPLRYYLYQYYKDIDVWEFQDLINEELEERKLVNKI